MIQQQQLTFGVDLGGTSTRVGLYDPSMRLLASSAFTTRISEGPQACVDEMAAVLDTVGRQGGVRHPDQILGVGIGSPGPINLRTGVLGLLPNLPGWDNFPLRDALATATGMPVILESDANAAAIAEWKLGAARTMHVPSLAMITLGTGVGSGLILDGKVWHGRFGMGGEVGHATVEPEGLLCGCGSHGCLEMFASANGVLRLAVHAAASAESSAALRAVVANPEGFTPLDIARLAPTDALARQVFARLGHYLGIGIANLLNTLDLPLIIVGGGVASSWPLFAPAMFQSIRRYSVVYRLAEPAQFEVQEPDRIFVCPASLGPAAGLLGAGLLPRLVAENAAEHLWSATHNARIPEMVHEA